METMRKLTNNLSTQHMKLARQIGRGVKKSPANTRILLVRDTLAAVAASRGDDLRHLLKRNVWATTESLAADFDAWGGAALIREGIRPMLGRTRLNDPEIVRMEARLLGDFLGKRTAAKLGLANDGLQALADEAAANNGLRIISKSWTLAQSVRTCGCQPAVTRSLDSRLAVLNPIKIAALAALVAADLVAMSTPATIPFGMASLATAAILMRRGC